MPKSIALVSALPSVSSLDLALVHGGQTTPAPAPAPTTGPAPGWCPETARCTYSKTTFQGLTTWLQGMVGVSHESATQEPAAQPAQPPAQPAPPPASN
jgi:hypothetical protein